MTRYRCPYCSVSIEHRPDLAGDRVACSKCHGYYYEPTDPLPGVRPEKAPDLELDRGGMGGALPAPAGAYQSSEPQIVATPVDINQIKQSLEPFDMVMEMKRRGQQAVMISLSPTNPQDANVVFSDNLTPDEVSDVILRIAVSIMQTKWPDVYQLVAGRIR